MWMNFGELLHKRLYCNSLLPRTVAQFVQPNTIDFPQLLSSILVNALRPGWWAITRHMHAHLCYGFESSEVARLSGSSSHYEATNLQVMGWIRQSRWLTCPMLIPLHERQLGNSYPAALSMGQMFAPLSVWHWIQWGGAVGRSESKGSWCLGRLESSLYGSRGCKTALSRIGWSGHVCEQHSEVGEEQSPHREGVTPCLPGSVLLHPHQFQCQSQSLVEWLMLLLAA